MQWTSSHSADPCAQNSPTEACSSPSVCSCAIDSWPLKHTEEKFHIAYIHSTLTLWQRFGLLFSFHHMGLIFSCIVYKHNVRLLAQLKPPCFVWQNIFNESCNDYSLSLIKSDLTREFGSRGCLHWLELSFLVYIRRVVEEGRNIHSATWAKVSMR